MEMQRAGNPLMIYWNFNLRKENEEVEVFPLEGKPLRLTLITPRGKKEIKDYAVKGSVIEWKFTSDYQKAYGDYSLMLEVLSPSGKVLMTADQCGFARIADKTCFSTSAVSSDTITLTSELTVVRIMPVFPEIGPNGNWWLDGADTGYSSVGTSAYEYALSLGYAGTEEDYAAEMAALPVLNEESKEATEAAINAAEAATIAAKNATNAAENANNASEEASTSASQAAAAASSANDAAEKADTAAEEAHTAAQNAESATERAEEAIEAFGPAIANKADLDNGKIIPSQLPDFILGQVMYGGLIYDDSTINASSSFISKYGNKTYISSSDASKYSGVYFIVTGEIVNGTIAGVSQVSTGDWIISTGSSWKKVDNSDAVTSVAGLVGNVNASALAAVLADLKDANSLARKSEFKTINGQSLVGTGDIKIEGKNYDTQLAEQSAKLTELSGEIEEMRGEKSVEITLEKGYVAYTSGLLLDSSINSRSKPINVEGYNSVAWRASTITNPDSAVGAAFFDKDGAFIIGQQYAAASEYQPHDYKIDIPVNATTFIFSVNNDFAEQAYAKLYGVSETQEEIDFLNAKIDAFGEPMPEEVTYPAYSLKSGYIAANDGTERTSSANLCSDYINVEGYDVVSFKGNQVTNPESIQGAAFYDSSKRLIRGIYYYSSFATSDVAKDYEENIPSDAAYFRFTINSSYASSAFLTIKKKPTLSKVLTEVESMMPEMVGHKELIIFETEGDGSLNSKKVADLYAEYDRMVQTFPEFIKRDADLGSVSYNGTTYEIRSYVIGFNRNMLIDHEPSTSEIIAESNLVTERKKKILVVSGMHGEEHTPTWGVMQAIDEILTSDKAWAQYIRCNYTIHLAPCLNPAGWSNMLRTDSAGNAMNRDEAYNDAESTYYMNWVAKHRDAELLIDCHGSQGHYAYLPVMAQLPFNDKICSIAHRLASAFFSNWKAFYNSISSGFGTTYSPFLVAKKTYDSWTRGRYACRMYQDYGMQSFAIETPDDIVSGSISQNDARNCKLTKDMLVNILQIL